MSVDELGIFLEHQGFSDDSIDDFLEHFGKKGMKWGVRNSQNNVSGGNGKKGLSLKTKRNLKVGAGILAAGGVAAALILKSRGDQNAAIASLARSSANIRNSQDSFVRSISNFQKSPPSPSKVKDVFRAYPMPPIGGNSPRGGFFPPIPMPSGGFRMLQGT